MNYRLALALAVLIAGCGGFESALPPDASVAEQSGSTSAVKPASPRQHALRDADRNPNAAPGGADVPNPVLGRFQGAGGQAGPADEAAQQVLQRKVVYNARLELVVPDFAPIPGLVDQLVRQHKARIEDSTVRSHSGRPRGGTWKLRVPVDNFDAFVAAARTLGEVRSERKNSEDISEHYYDIDARIRNKKLYEAKLNKLVEERGGNLEEVLKFEVEIGRLREEIERLEGRLRVLTELAALATVELQFDEVKNYVPPEAPVFTTRIARSWSNSLAELKVAGQDLVVGLVYAGPWLVVLAIPGVPIVIWLRAKIRRLFRPQYIQATLAEK
jgi:hypothetical protein